MDFLDEYYKKYIKYKIKYLELKKLSYNDNNDIDKNNHNHTQTYTHINNYTNTNKYSSKQINNISGGGYFYEQNDLIKRINMLDNKKFNKDLYKFSSIYLKANLTNPEIIKKYSKIRKQILKNNSFPPHSYHLTLLIFEINLDYPIVGDSIAYTDEITGKRKVRKNLSFLDQDEIKTNFESGFKNMILTREKFEILGKLVKVKIGHGSGSGSSANAGLNSSSNSVSGIGKEIGIGVKNPETNDCVKYPGSYFVDKFQVNNKNLITTFRIRFYDKLNEFMKLEYVKSGGKPQNYIGYRADNEIDPDYILIFYDNFSKNVPLIAIKKFYYGKHTWTPHISIFNMDELVQSNTKFLEKYIVNFLTNQDRAQSDQMIFNELKTNSVVKELVKKTAKQKITIEDIEFELQI